ncbi:MULTISPECIES: PilW family protein [Acinetobacter]|uniref:Prepilin-type cleavage/methylation domain-containing protein n=1 Tax=Acinetobacter indicus TaxID=756892 RepID=A0A7S6VSN6_9GAMM|nr:MULTISPECIES: PilW family protein [Acinetobacter]QOW44198.1 prepilin-type cleavage/methylation domain-containing protein [Acinetobacter indicus]
MKRVTGFTIVELMIALSLGLLIVAAALLMIFSGQKNIALQKNSESLQDDQNFGLAYIAKNIRQANLFNESAELTASSPHGGIVFGTANLDSFLTVRSDFTTKYATIAGAASNMRIKTGTNTFSNATNDQLVIQYRPAETGGYDCEGKQINSTNLYILERYFVRVDTNGSGTDEERAALACASSHYSTDLAVATPLEGSTTATTGLYGGGQIIMKRVDLFNVRFLTQTGSNYRYMTVAQYNAAAPKPRILAVQLAVIARAADTTTESSVSNTQEFSIFGQTVTQKNNLTKRYVRTPIVQTIALRNALGARS